MYGLPKFVTTLLDSSTHAAIRGTGWSPALMNLYRWSDLLAALAYLTLLGLGLYHIVRTPEWTKRLRGVLPLTLVFLLIQAINRILETSDNNSIGYVTAVVVVKVVSNLMLWSLIVFLVRLLPKLMADALLKSVLAERDHLQIENARLTEREARFGGIVSSAMDAIISIDANQKIIVFNAAAEAMFRCRASEVVGHNLDRLIPVRYREAHGRYVAGFGDNGETGRSMRSLGTIHGLRADGQEFPLEATISQVWAGGHRFYSVILRDISARVEMEQELRRRAEELATRDRTNSEWLAMLAHELRNPLAPILNAVYILRSLGAHEGKETERQRQKALIERQVKHLSRLVEDLLDVSRVTRGMILLDRKPTVLGEVALAAIEAVTSQIEAKGQTLHFSPTEEAFCVHADAVRLEQVVVNLVTNACKYTPQGGEIWVNLDGVGEFCTITIRDTGIGVPPDMLGRIFDLFHQEDRSLDRTQGGLGIGLTLVKAIVELHGGRVEVYSAGLNQGSEFQVWLPCGPPPEGGNLPLGGEPLDEGSDLETGNDRAGEQRVLIVDDNQDAADTLAELCRIWGYQADVALNGWKALAQVREQHYDTILLDIGLPGMDGYEVARRLRAQQNNQDTRLVAVTGYGAEADREKSRAAGFDQHCLKPVNPDALRSLLGAADGDGASGEDHEET